MKNGGVLLPCEGELEYKHCLLMEFDKSIESYYLQPFSLHTNVGKYTPDVLIKYVDQSFSLAEVKPSETLEKPSIKEKLEGVTARVISEGYSFKIVTEEDCGSEIDHLNRELIHRAQPELLSERVLGVIRGELGIGYKGTVSDLRRLLSPTFNPDNIVESLLFSDFLSFKRCRLLFENTVVWYAQ